MPRDSTEQETSGATEEKYTPDQNRTLSDAILETIEEHKYEDVSEADFVLYDDIDLDALDELFQHGANPQTNVGFDTDDVRVELYGDSGVVIRVRDHPSNSQ